MHRPALLATEAELGHERAGIHVLAVFRDETVHVELQDLDHVEGRRPPRGRGRTDRSAGRPLRSARRSRWGLLVGEATDPDRPDAPGLVIMTPDGDMEASSLGAKAWFSRLPDDDGRHDGVPTRVLAKELGVSPHTVQQHLKSMFDKCDVNSRGELVAKIWFDCYDLRTRDNRERIQVGESIRGGPKTFTQS